MNFLKFSNDKLDINALTELATSAKCGAVSLFIGTTRDNFEDKTVLSLQYEAYESMGLKELTKICDEMRSKWNSIENIVIYHRLGHVPIRESSIVIAVSSPHRAEALQATDWCINTVKKTVPVWKKEIYADSSPAWKENKESQIHPPKLKKFKAEAIPEIKPTQVAPHLIQIKVSNNDLSKRIDHFMERKRNEINIRNIQEFCVSDRNSDSICARIDALVHKRKDSKGHLQVSRVLNTFHRDQTKAEYLTKYIPPNGVEERLLNLEMQLSLSTPAPTNIYRRLKQLEDRMLYLESISPEYINFWDKTKVTNAGVKKKIFSIEEIDSFIEDLEKNT